MALGTEWLCVTVPKDGLPFCSTPNYCTHGRETPPKKGTRNWGTASWASWVAVKELKLSYYIGETLLFTIYTHYGNLI